MKELVNVGGSPEYVKAITSQWTGERLQDGRAGLFDEERLSQSGGSKLENP